LLLPDFLAARQLSRRSDATHAHRNVTHGSLLTFPAGGQFSFSRRLRFPVIPYFQGSARFRFRFCWGFTNRHICTSSLLSSHGSIVASDANSPPSFLAKPWPFRLSGIRKSRRSLFVWQCSTPKAVTIRPCRRRGLRLNESDVMLC